MGSEIIRSSVAGPIEDKIVNKLMVLNPSYLKIRNDSHKHSHHQGMVGRDNKQESHFNVEIVSDEFTGKGLPARHRLIYKLLDEQFEHDGLHALQLKTKTAQEVAPK